MLTLWRSRLAIAPAVCLLIAPALCADTDSHKVLIRDVASVEGIRSNSLVGYGLVVGLKGTGDKQQTYFTIQTLASILQPMGVEIPSTVIQTTVQVKNVAAVFVTASLPPFSRPGMPVDVTVSSAGDARSLEGGLLPLAAADETEFAFPMVMTSPTVAAGFASCGESVAVVRSPGGQRRLRNRGHDHPPSSGAPRYGIGRLPSRDRGPRRKP